jgi:hypothetical protein
MLIEEMRLDGNAAGGALRELFARDVTEGIATCAGCGDARAVGALLDYGTPLGVVLRCPGCDHVMLRLTQVGGWLRVDLSGIAMLALPDAPASRDRRPA